jgi:hypothetical protein
MIHELNSLKPLARSEYRRALKNPAVAHCHKNWERVFRSVFKETNSKAVASIEASQAFRSAMPLLLGDKNIRDFVACVNFGLNSSIFHEDTATPLFYAAQVAHNIGSRDNTTKKAPQPVHKCFGSLSLPKKTAPPAPSPPLLKQRV